MKITITSTDKLTDVNGARCRVWEGITELGAKCIVFVHLIAVPSGEDSTHFDEELAQQLPPGRVFDLRNIL